MTTNKKKKWTSKELEKFKTLILEKRNKVIDDLEEARKRADEAKKNNSVKVIYSERINGNVSTALSALNVDMAELYDYAIERNILLARGNIRKVTPK